MPLPTTSAAILRRLTATGGRRRSAAELVLAYVVWGGGVSLFFSPFANLVDGASLLGLYVFLIYSPLIQLPLAIHYDRALGVTATPGTRWQFVGARLFHPVVVYGLFLVIWLLLFGLALMPELPPDFPLDEVLGLVYAISTPAFPVYFAIVVFAALLLKWGQRGILALIRTRRIIIAHDGATADDERVDADGRADAEDAAGETPLDGGDFSADERSTDADRSADAGDAADEAASGDGDFATDDPTTDAGDSAEQADAGDEQADAAGEAVPSDGGDATDESPGDADREQTVRFASLLGLVMVPVGAGWAVGQPSVGVSVASLVLTVYQVAYTDGTSSEASGSG